MDVHSRNPSLILPYSLERRDVVHKNKAIYWNDNISQPPRTLSPASPLDFVPLEETAVTLNRVFFGQNRRGSLHTDHLLHQMPAMVCWCFCREVWLNVSLHLSPPQHTYIYICTKISHFVSPWTSHIYWIYAIHRWVSQPAGCIHSLGWRWQNMA